MLTWLLNYYNQYSIGGFEWISINLSKVQHSHSRHQNTSNLLRIYLKGISKFNEIWPLEGAMYIPLWYIFRGHPQNVSFMQFSQKIYGFRQKKITGLLELIQLYKQSPLEKFFLFTIYQNYTLALIIIIIISFCQNE